MPILLAKSQPLLGEAPSVAVEGCQSEELLA